MIPLTRPSLKPTRPGAARLSRMYWQEVRGAGTSQREPDPFHRLVPFKKAGAGSAQQPLSWFEQLFAYGSHTALAACLFGFAWAAGSYFSGGHPPFSPLKPPITRTIAPQDSAERIELLRTAQKMAEDIRALKVDVEALRAAQSLTAKDTAGIAGLKTRLDAVKTETGTSIAELAGKVERMQREPEAKLSQIIQRLDRMEGQLATPLAAGSSGAPRHRQRRYLENRCTLRRRNRRLTQRTVSEIRN